MEPKNWLKCAEVSSFHSVVDVDDSGYAGIPKSVVAPVFELARPTRWDLVENSPSKTPFSVAFS
jgi:hypothetical protein